MTYFMNLSTQFQLNYRPLKIFLERYSSQHAFIQAHSFEKERLGYIVQNLLIWVKLT